MKLVLHTQPEVPLEAEVISPDFLNGKTADEVAALTLFHGNNEVPLSEFFDVSGEIENAHIEVEGDLTKVKLLGHKMSDGSLTIKGSVGAHLGAEMTGGEILVEGNAGDWIGREMSGGRIIIKGDAGHLVGSAVRGSATGMLGGEIIIQGNARNEVGNGMRRGLIAIGGDSGDFTGVNMKAGTIFVLGKLGQRPGAGMIRGSIISTQSAELLPTFTYNTTFQPSFLRNYMIYFRKLGLDIRKEYIDGEYQRWSGDSLELNKGEILLYAD
ncbi:MAG TPA: formylmethanofuran dehydrogenase subunit C [Crenotrichaceae bacterium]|nr:formylmethanofuran dehydrogenase subunit C [Crenotrichaceae bacterium]